VHQLSLNLRADLFGTQIRVNCVEPGATKAEFLAVRFKGDPVNAETLLRGANPMSVNIDVAGVINFFAIAPSNINLLESMPVSQAFAPLAINRI
jgi:3-hydroxy acid dehydrogenase/malonic semialdehyde reductase